MSMQKAEQYKVIVISTAHIHATDTGALEKACEDTQMVLCRDTGYFIKLYEDVEMNLRDDYSLGLCVLIREAHAQGFRMIELNGDADKLDGYKVYNW